MRRIHFETIDSTSTYAKELVKGELPLTEPVLVTAECQTAGRGRTGKSFSSLRGNGLYMTVAFPVNRKPEDCLFITVAAAVAVCEVLAEAGCPSVKIKWVNDIYLDDRKVCGILTEAVTDHETGIMRCVLTGIGINIDADLTSFPEELKQKAGTLRNLHFTGGVLAEKIAEHLIKRTEDSLSTEDGKKEILRIYREKSMLIGREVTWEENGTVRSGIASDIDDNANLIVRTETGAARLDSGYVSVLFGKTVKPS